MFKMKKILFFFIAFMFTLSCLSQIGFEKGYYIDNNERKTECLIKNLDYSNKTKKLSYKLAEKTQTQTTDLNHIKEIVIYGLKKYVKRYVDIGKPNELNERDKSYSFNKEVLWLKVLVEGEANLYAYRESGNHFFFYGLNDIQTEQLVFKTYLSGTGTKRKNNGFKKQLFENLSCESITFEDANSLKYEHKDLADFVIRFNECRNSDAIIYYTKSKDFNISLKARYSGSSLKLDEQSSLRMGSFDFGNKTHFGLGIEAEIFFPFAKKKWSISIEPTYHGKYSSQLRLSDVENILKVVDVNYTSFEVPMTLRHYSFVGEGSKVFFNASLIYDSGAGSDAIEFRLENLISGVSTQTEVLLPSGSLNPAFGVGYKYKNRYSIEARFSTSRNIINHIGSYRSSYNTLSIIFGYTL